MMNNIVLTIVKPLLLLQATGVEDDAVHTLDDTITAAVCAERSLNALKEFCSKYHSRQVKHIGCYVRGVSGFVCDDFMKGFTVLDADGEFSKEVTVQYISVTHSHL
jgi:transposase-like protein